MEGDLDSIADGNMTYVSLMNDFYTPFEHSLEQAEDKYRSENKGIKCELCGGDMIIKVSRNGRFLGCSNYPECRNTKPLPKNGNAIDETPEKSEPVIAEGVTCDICGSPMYIKQSKYGSFYGCSNYPECKGVKPITTGIHCPKCENGMLVERYAPKRRKKFWGCSDYPKCDFITNNEPINEHCPKCGNPYLELRYKKVDDGYEKYKECPHCKEKFSL
jgi:DNA topoisomerase-1